MNQRKGSIKRVFPGGNTPLGFYSFYDYIVTPDATRITVIKGGPGVGKSTFMRRIGEAMVEHGYDVEFHHCSSDNGSLDGVVIPALGSAIIDGTAPHVVDPKYPGAVDEILYLGEFWNERLIRAHRAEIVNLTKEISRTFARAYRFLQAAKAVYDDLEAANCEALDAGKANRYAEKISTAILGNVPAALTPGRDRHLFASGITPDGMVNYIDTIIGPCKKRFVIVGGPGTGKSTLLKKIAMAALERGYFVEMYHCPLNPQKIEHVVVPDLGVALTKSIEPHTYEPGPEDEVIDMNSCLDTSLAAKNEGIMAENQEIFDKLFQRAVGFIGKAKEHHDKLEEYYVASMDFAAIDQVREKTVSRLLEEAHASQTLGQD